MTSLPLGAVLRRWLQNLNEAANELSDAQLLECFRAERDEAAFATLVQRHGPLVLGVCRRLLRDNHDADDAFQATFLVLACRASSIRRTESVASFLYGTACRIARRLQKEKARRRTREQQAANARPEATPSISEERERHTLLHEELNRLPRKYRDVLILCYLQNKSHQQAARELGYPLGSMSRHLSRARELLRERLLRRGVLAALATSALAEQASAAVSSALLHGTLDTVRRHALAAALLAGSTPSTAVLLAQGVMHAASLTRWVAASLVLTMSLVFAGAMAALQSPADKETPIETKANRQRQLPGEEQARVDLYGDPLPDGVLLRLGTARLRHGLATQLVFAADGKTLLSAGRDQTVRFWDIADGKLRRVQRMPLPLDVSLGQGSVAALSADGKMLAQMTANHLFVWNVAEGKEIHRIPIGPRFGGWTLDWLTFSADGKSLAGGDNEGKVLLWDVAGGKEKQQLKHKDRLLRRGAFAPDGKRLAVCGDDHLVVWDLPSGKEVRVIRLPKGGPSNALVFSPDGQTIASSNLSEAVLWRVAMGEREAVPRFEVPLDSWIKYYLAFAPDGKTLAVGVKDRIVLWDRVAGKEAKRLEGYRLGPLCFSADGKLLASLRTGKIQLWDVAGGKQLQERTSHDEGVGALAFAPDGKLLASASYDSDSVYLWDTHSGKRLRVLTLPNAGVRRLAFSADGTTLIAGGGIIQMWDAASGKKGRAFPFHITKEHRIDQLLNMHLSSDGKRLTVLGLETAIAPDGFLRDTKCSLTTWDAMSGERLERRPCPPSFQGTCFSPDGKRVALPNGWGLKIHDTAVNRDLFNLKSIRSGPVAFSPDGRILAAGATPTPYLADGDAEYRKSMAAEKIELWDMTTGERLMRLDTGAVYWRAFSPDGRYLVTAWMDGLHLWEIASGKEVLYRPAHEKLRSAVARSFASGLAFAPDGRSVATGHDDTNVLIWDMAPATRQQRRLSAEDLDGLWTELAGADAARAYRAAGTLIADAEHAVPYVSRRLAPVPEPTLRLRRLIADLDSAQFTVREAARKELTKMGDAAYPALRQALKDKPSLELRRSIQNLLPTSFVVRSPEKLRQIRAVMVLEQIGDAEARRLLKRLADGAAEARQTREAKAALQRLSK